MAAASAVRPATAPRPVKARVGRVPLIGRASELALIRAEMEAALAGSPRVVAIAGEAGIGKTRLLREAVCLARDRPDSPVVLVGRCLDEAGLPPYLPWFDALRGRALAAGDPALDPLRSLPPRLSGRAGDVGASRSPEERKLRLFADVSDAVERVAAERPAVLVFDDFQWSDAASNELLRFLLIQAPPVPLLVILAYRADEAASATDLRRTLAELDRHRLLTAVPVAGLSAAETAELVRGLLDGAPCSPELAAAIHAHGDGNPFFVEEITRSLVDEGRLAVDPRTGARTLLGADVGALPLPAGVAAVVERRLARLGESCRAVIDAAAVIGREIVVDVVAACVDMEPVRVAGLLDEAARAALVRTAPAGDGEPSPDYVFLHDRVREVVVAGIGPARRRALHARIGAVLEAQPGAPDLPRLAAIAHHLHLARQPAAAAALVRLGDAAMRAHAHGQAADAFRRAVSLGGAGAAEDASMPPPGELLLRLGDAALAAGRDDAISAYAAAEERFAAAGDRLGMARARRRLGTAHARREAFDDAVAYLDGALTLLSAAGDGGAIPPEQAADLAEVLVELGAVRGLSLGLYDAAVSDGRRALALATGQAPDNPGLEARARLALANTLMRAGRLAEGYALLPVARARALAAGDPALAAEVAGAVANYRYWVGDLAASEAAANERLELARAAGDPYALRHALPWLAFLAASRGDWERAERLAAEAEPHVGRLASPEPRAFVRKVVGFARLMRRQTAEAVAALEEAVAGFRSSGPATLVWYLGCLATAYCAAGDERAARRVEAEVMDLVEALPAGALPRAPALAELGLLAAMRGDRSAARRIYPDLRPYAGQLHWVLTDRVLGLLAVVLDDLAAADRHFAAAAALAERGGIRPELALTLAAHGRALRRSPDPAVRAEGDDLLRQAAARLGPLGMPEPAGFGETPERTARGAAPIALPAGLTEREAEVLSLVAQGLTNREIGDRLHISEKTVTNHLTHVFTKAGLDNRAGAVAFALRHGLA